MPLSVSEGAVLPSNFVIFGGFAGEPDGSSWAAVDPDGASIPFEFDVQPEEGLTRLVPSRPLIAGVDYLLTPFGPDSEPAWGRGPIPITVSADSDEDAPDAPIATSEIQAAPPQLFTSCGDFWGGTWVRIFLERSDGVGLYRLTNAEGAVVNLAFADRFEQWPDEPVFLTAIEEKGGEERYTVTAVDHAGQVSPGTVVTASLGCPGACAGADPSLLGLAALTLLARRRGRPAVRRASR